MKYIYKIENLINHKVYIGQTNNPQRRFSEHRAKGYETNTHKVLYYAFDKYGINNFSFEIIEETDIPNEREKYWIKFYDSFENGYNMTEGGDLPPQHSGVEHPKCNHSIDEISLVKTLLKNSKLSTKEIANLTHYNISSINRINLGELHFDSTLNYPIRKENTKIDRNKRAKMIIDDLLNTNLTQKEIALKYKVGRTTITAINNGQNFRDNNLNYPLRK